MARKKTRANRSVKSRKSRWLLPYPAVIFFLLCAGVLLVMWTFNALADDVQVSAKVAAPPVTGPAVIGSPSDGDHFTSIPVTISGSCPSDGSGGYVKVYRNNVFSGVSICDLSNNFSVSSDLFAGANTITVQIYNVTDDIGPVSAPITVYYDAPQPPPSSPQAPSSSGSGSSPSSSESQPSQGAGLPFILSSDFQYVGYYVGQTASWKINISGGSPPYAINVNWGDGKSSLYSSQATGILDISHIYKTAGMAKNHSYPISISGADAIGGQSSLQLFVIINSRSVPPAEASIFGSTCSTSGISYSSVNCYVRTKNLLKFIWPAYGVVTLMAVSYMLGEREELLKLGKKGLSSRRGRKPVQRRRVV